MKNTLLVTIFFFFLAMSGQASDMHIRIATPEWINQTNADGTGLYFDIIREVYESEGYSVQYEIVPWARAEHMVKTGNSDMMPGDIKSENDGFIYPVQLFLNEKTSVVFRKDSSVWANKSTLSGKKCVWLSGYDYHKTLGVDVKWFEIDSRDAGIKSVFSGRVDFYIDAKIDIMYYFKKYPGYRKHLEIRDIHTVDLYLKFTNSERGKKLAAIYDKRMKKLVNSKKFHRIFRKYNYDFPVYNPL